VRGAADVAGKVGCVLQRIAWYYDAMDRETISFRLDAKKRQALDVLAQAQDRDRTYVLNEAIDAYLDVHQWQLEHIQEGIRQADAGDFASDAAVAAAFSRWRK
jgi:RHH-type transcriptional regulator, rel operon repressor / antitoxin RelB